MEKAPVFQAGSVEELWSLLALFLWQFLLYEALLQSPEKSLILGCL